MDAKRGEIVDYEIKDDGGNVVDTLPMLVVHVNDQDGGDGAVVGIVFHTDATFHSVTIPKDAPPEQAPVTAAPEQTAEQSFDALTPEDRATFLRDELARMSDADRAALRAELDPAPAPVPPAVTPADAQTPPVPDSAPPSDTGTGGQ